MKAFRIPALMIALSTACFGMTAPGFAAGAIPAADLNDPLWISNQDLIVAHNGDTSAEYYKINIHSRSASLLVAEDANATEVAVSADGSKLAYINNNGEVFVASTADGKATKVSSDNAAKSDMAWSSDNSKLYFFQGDKLDTLAVIDVASAKTTVVLADTVPYKSNLVLSKDGKKALYLVNKTAVTDEAKGFTVNTANTDPQYYTLDLTVAKAKAVQLTKSTDNKSYGTFLTDGSIVYLTTDTTKEDAAPIAHYVYPTGKTVTFAENVKVQQPLVTADGKLEVLATDSADHSKVYDIHSSLLKIEKYAVKDSASALSVSPDGSESAYIVKDGDSTKLVISDKNGSTELN